jgi:hypothetical protein
MRETGWNYLFTEKHYHAGEKYSNRVVIIPSLRPLDQALARLPFWACSYEIWSVERNVGKQTGNLLNRIYLLYPWKSQ